MTVALLVQLQAAVIAELNDAAFAAEHGEEFVAVRKYRAEYEVKDLTDLKVTVVPKAADRTIASRGETAQEFQIDVAVQQRLPADFEQERIDELLLLVEQIAEWMLARRPATFTTAICVAVSETPIYSVEHLDAMRVLTAPVTLTFKVL